MNVGQARTRLVQAGAAFAAVALIAGCGSTYRSVITPTTSTGPASETTSYLAVVSAPSTTSKGVATLIDYSGDTVMAVASIGTDPYGFALDYTGSTGYTWNRDNTLTSFPISTTSLLTKNVGYSTLATSSTNVLGIYAPSSGLWVGDTASDAIDVYTSSPPTYKQSVTVPAVPVMVVGLTASSERYFAISQTSDDAGIACNTGASSVASDGYVTPIEISTYTADTAIEVGKCPVYAVVSTDYKRLFVLNRGSDTISVINIPDATLDSCTPFKNQAGQTVTCHPTLPLSTTAVTATTITPTNGTTSANLPTTAQPVYAEYNAATSQLVVANYDGSVSIIDVSLDEYGNDSSTFGTTYTVSVGTHPAAVTVLYDGSMAYTANQSDETVSVVNLSSHALTKTLPVVGHPRSITSTQNSETAKVYVSSPDSNYITVINAEDNLVDTTITVSGEVVDIHTSTQNGTSTNYNNVSRRPGYGQPCNLPDTTSTTYSASLTTCQALP